MILKSLDSNFTGYYKNLPGLSTSWVLRDGNLIGYVYDSRGNLVGSCTFSTSK